MEQFKKAQVMMLPTNKTANIGANNWYLQKTNILIINNLISNLYIISNNEIKQNDWCLNISKNIIYQKDNLPMDIMWKKIIATTDTSLTINSIYGINNFDSNMFGDKSEIIKLPNLFKLPQPSQQFIEKYIDSYNKGEIITDVLVEYEQKKYIITLDTCGNNIVPKINYKNNSITIKNLKNSWNREEIKLLIEKYQNTFGTVNASSTFVQNWIKKNL